MVLFRATLNGNSDLVECLVEHGADINKKKLNMVKRHYLIDIF